MNRSFLVVGTILASAIPTGASAQGTRSCSSSTLSTYEDWVAIASGVSCPARDAELTGLSAGVSFYVAGPWDPPGFSAPTTNSNSNNNSSNNNSNTTSNNGTPNLGCSPYVRLPWDPPGPPPAPCTNNDNSNNNDNTNSGADDSQDSPQPTGEEEDLNALVNEPNATPEPATLLLVASGLGGVGALARRRKARASSES